MWIYIRNSQYYFVIVIVCVSVTVVTSRVYSQIAQNVAIVSMCDVPPDQLNYMRRDIDCSFSLFHF